MQLPCGLMVLHRTVRRQGAYGSVQVNGVPPAHPPQAIYRTSVVLTKLLLEDRERVYGRELEQREGGLCREMVIRQRYAGATLVSRLSQRYKLLIPPQVVTVFSTGAAPLMHAANHGQSGPGAALNSVFCQSRTTSQGSVPAPCISYPNPE